MYIDDWLVRRYQKMNFMRIRQFRHDFGRSIMGNVLKGDYAVILELLQSYDRWVILVLWVLFEEIQKDLSQ